MAQIVLSDCKLWVGGFDFSGKLNAIALDDNPDMLDNTTFGMTAKSRKKGLDVIAASLAGFWEQPPDEYFSTLGTSGIPMTVAPTSTIGGVAYLIGDTQNVEYQWGGNVGELAKFSVKAESVGLKMVRGNLLMSGTKTLSANGTAYNLGAVSASKYLYGVIHVTAAATAVGDTLNVIIQSDSQEDFGGTPETQIAFTEVLGNVANGRTYQFATPVAGEITDTWWRAVCTIVDAGDDDASFTFCVAMGIA